MWKKFPETMLAKATTTLARRRGFADVISGIASADELDQAGLAAPEALTQGTPKLSKPVKEFKGSSPKAKAAAVPSPAVPASVDDAAESLAAATAGKTVEAPVEEKPATPGQDDLMAVGLELGFTTHAIDGILSLIKGDFVKGIATMKSKDAGEIEKLNAKFAPAETVDQNW